MWFYAKGGRRFGPVAPAELRRLAAAGQLDPEDLLMEQGRTSWVPARTVAGLFPAPGPDAAPGKPPGAGPWFIARNHQKFGPASLDQLRRLAAEGRLGPTDMVLEEGATRWTPAGSVHGVFPLAARRAGMPAAAGLGRRIVHELATALLAPFTLAARLLRYARASRRTGRLAHEERAARLALGRRMYEVGGGDSWSRAQVAALDEEIYRAEAARGSAGNLPAQRDRLILLLAEQGLVQGTAPAKTEAAYERAGKAMQGSRRHASALEAARVGLFPRGGANRARVLIGCGADLLILLLAGVAVLESRPSSVITSASQDRNIADAVGFVVCGVTFVNQDGREKDLETSTGSGFAISPEGHVLTNQHVVKDVWERMLSGIHSGEWKLDVAENRRKTGIDVRLKVWVFFGKQKFAADVLAVSEKYDFAILKIDRRHVPYFSVSGSDGPPRGAKVTACGFPRAARERFSTEEILESQRREQTYLKIEDAFEASDFDYVATNGTISRIKEEPGGRRWVQHNAPINPGNSGGPLLLDDGVVLGINTERSTEEGQQGIFFSLAMPQLKQELEAIVPGVVWR